MKDRVYFSLRHINDSIRFIEAVVVGMKKSEFFLIETTDEMAFRAIKNCYTEIGEAVILLQSEAVDICNRNSGVKWRKIRQMRNKIVHQYFNIDVNRLWDSICIDLLILKNAVAMEIMMYDT